MDMKTGTKIQQAHTDQLADKRNGKRTTALAHPGKAGNQNALDHGLYTRDKNALKLRARSVRRLVNKAYELCPWLTPTDRATVQTWAEVVKLKSICFVALEKTGVYRVDGDDLVGRRLLDEYRRLSTLELRFAGELGLTPVSRVNLGVGAAMGQYYGDLALRASRIRNGNDDN